MLLTNVLECVIIYERSENVSAISSVDRVPGYEPVGRRFESRMARQTRHSFYNECLFCFYFSFFVDSTRTQQPCLTIKKYSDIFYFRYCNKINVMI